MNSETTGQHTMQVHRRRYIRAVPRHAAPRTFLSECNRQGRRRCNITGSLLPLRIWAISWVPQAQGTYIL